MKNSLCFLVWAAALFAGCTASAGNLVLDPVGPQPASPVAPDRTGQLIVFSAYSVHGPGPMAPDAPEVHTAYEIVGPSGSRQTVTNQAGAWGSDPSAVALTPGWYRVMARANGYGKVTVPVLIVVHETTVVHLEGGASEAENANLAGSNAVRLPDGRIIGWRAVR